VNPLWTRYQPDRLDGGSRQEDDRSDCPMCAQGSPGLAYV
jgi:hypothetical protein